MRDHRKSILHPKLFALLKEGSVFGTFDNGYSKRPNLWYIATATT